MALFILHQKKENFATDSATFCKEIGHRIKTTTFFNFKSLVCSFCEDFYYYASSYFNVRKTDLNRLTDLSRQTKSFNHCWQKWKQGFFGGLDYTFLSIIHDDLNFTRLNRRWCKMTRKTCLRLFFFISRSSANDFYQKQETRASSSYKIWKCHTKEMDCAAFNLRHF